MLEISTRERSVLHGDLSTNLSPAQWEIFQMLWETPEPLDVEQIAALLYPHRDPDSAAGAVRSVLLRLREQLREIGADDHLINLRGHGYVIKRYQEDEYRR